MKRFVTSVIVLGILAIGITAEASDYDCELTIDASEHDEGNPAFPTSGCDDTPALGWYDDQEFMISGFSGMTAVTDGEIIDLGIGTNMKVITIDKASKSKKESKPQKSKSTQKASSDNSSNKKDENKESENDKVSAKKENEKQGNQKEDKLKEQEKAKKQGEEFEDEEKTEDETTEGLKDNEDDLASNSTLKNVLVIVGVVIIGIVGFFLLRIKGKIG